MPPLSAQATYRDPELGPSRQLDLPGGPIRVHERGEGPAVVLVHGLLVNANLWRKVVPRLAPEARVVTLDLPLGPHAEATPPGTDLSPPAFGDLIADAIEALGLEDVTLVGNDTGGGLVQIAVSRRPERIGALVLTSCDAFEHFPPPMVKPLLPPLKHPTVAGALFAPMRLGPVQGLFFKPLAHQPIERAVRDSWVLPALTDKEIRRDIAAAVRDIEPSHTLKAAEQLAHFDRPAVVAWSADDVVFARRHGERLAELLPQGRLELIEGARTFSAEDRPARLAEIIAEMTRRAVPAAA